MTGNSSENKDYTSKVKFPRTYNICLSCGNVYPNSLLCLPFPVASQHNIPKTRREGGNQDLSSQGEQGPLRKPGMVSSHCPWKHPTREKLKRGVGSKTEGPQTELLENRKVSLSAPQPNFLYFLTSFSLKLRTSILENVGGRGICSSGFLALPRHYPWRQSPFTSSALLLVGQRQSRRDLSFPAWP